MPRPIKSFRVKNSGRFVGQKSVIELPMNTTRDPVLGSSITRLLSFSYLPKLAISFAALAVIARRMKAGATYVFRFIITKVY